MSVITVDAMGEQCPVPVIKTRKALQEIKEPCTVQVHVDNSTAEQNVLRLASSLKIDARSIKDGHRHYIVTLNVRHALEAPEELSCESCTGTVLVVGSDMMGSGSEELGGILMKGFLYAVSKREQLPKTAVFFNGGAKLTTEGSASLEDLRVMEENGVEILTCGTCLDYYGLKEKLAVGKVTNMYHIVELLSTADKVIKP